MSESDSLLTKNKMKNYIIKMICILSLFSFGANAQITKAVIKTSGNCETCKETLEHNIKFEKGVKSVSFDVDSKMLTVQYDAKKTTIEAVKIAVTKLGYDADNLTADPKAYSKLKDCCKKDGHNH